MSDESPPVLDTRTIDGLRELCDPGDDAFLRELFGQFALGYRNLRSQLEESLRSGDLETAERASHSIKGSAANVGAADLAKVADHQQEFVEKGDLSSASALLPALDVAWEQARAALDALCPGSVDPVS